MQGIRKGRIGWGGRIRTFTVLINSEVSYQLDHAPAGISWLLRGGPEPAGEACKAMKNIKSIAWSVPSARAEWAEGIIKMTYQDLSGFVGEGAEEAPGNNVRKSGVRFCFGKNYHDGTKL
jgi:hypothetical protein